MRQPPARLARSTRLNQSRGCLSPLRARSPCEAEATQHCKCPCRPERTLAWIDKDFHQDSVKARHGILTFQRFYPGQMGRDQIDDSVGELPSMQVRTILYQGVLTKGSGSAGR